MYGRIPEKKLTQQDMVLSCANVKHELAHELDVENRRVNVDSAKKKAVLYRMEYEGFRQMVLGANLYTIKSKDLNEFSLGGDKRIGTHIHLPYTPQDPVFNPSRTTFNSGLSPDNQDNLQMAQ